MYISPFDFAFLPGGPCRRVPCNTLTNLSFFYFQGVDRLSFIIKSTKLLCFCLSSLTAYILKEKLTILFHMLLLDDKIVTIQRKDVVRWSFGLISNGNLKIHLKAELLHATALHLGQLVEPTKDKMDLSLGILAALLQLSSHSHKKGPKNRKHNYSYCAMEIGHKILLRTVQSVGSKLIVSNVTFHLLKNWVERISLPQNSYSLL